MRFIKTSLWTLLAFVLVRFKIIVNRESTCEYGGLATNSHVARYSWLLHFWHLLCRFVTLFCLSTLFMFSRSSILGPVGWSKARSKRSFTNSKIITPRLRNSHAFFLFLLRLLQIKAYFVFGLAVFQDTRKRQITEIISVDELSWQPYSDGN